jgi:2-phospho-L-lactate guanylyltransferase
VEALILIPIKNPVAAKQRLSSLLAADERTRLCRAMLDDLARALEGVSYPVAVLTDSESAASDGARRGWRVLREPSQTSESRSVDEASRRLASEGIPAVLRLPADIPLVVADDIARLLELVTSPFPAVLAPSRDCRGTNAILRRPPTLFPSRFGPDSLALHLREALRVGVNCAVVAVSGIALDLDEPEDVALFLERPSDTETYRLLLQLGLDERLASHAAKQRANPRAEGNP